MISLPNWKTPSIEKDFLRIVFFSSFIPFVVSLLFLSLILRDADRKIEQASTQFQHTQELEILDVLHKNMSLIYQVSEAPEMAQYFSSTMETEKIYQKNLTDFLKNNSSYSFLFPNSQWIILSPMGKALISFSANITEVSRSYFHEKDGAYYDEKNQNILLFHPLSLTRTTSWEKKKNIYAYVGLVIPLSSVKLQYKNLIDIVHMPEDLSALSFHTQFQQVKKNTIFHFLYYFYIFIFIFFNTIGIYFGVRFFREKIIEKINNLTMRVTNEIELHSQFQEKVSLSQEKVGNEIDTLSNVLNRYLKYVLFLQYEMEKSSKLVAVGNIAHTIAHDLRKPFSNTSLFLEQLEKSDDFQDTQCLVQEFKPSLKASMQTLEHLLQEIMDAGIHSLQVQNSVSFVELLRKSFLQVPFQQRASEMTLRYEFTDDYLLAVDEQRVVRVLSNLISNALEVMGEGGSIWIKAVPLPNNGLLEIIVGNSHSYISPQDIPYLFEPFYTKGKKNGTGLGLAIAQKIIALHGGHISCRSESGDPSFVEFVFTLPYQEVNTFVPNFIFPKKIKDIWETKEIENNLPVLPSLNSVFSESVQQKLCLIDDDLFIGRSWKRIAKDVTFEFFLSPEEFLAWVEACSLEQISDLWVVSDFYFGGESKYNFYEFILRLKEKGFEKLFVSSDEDLKNMDAEFLRAQGVLAIEKKPLTMAQLSAKYREKIEGGQ